MKKIIIILLLCTTLCSCGTQADNVTDVTEKPKNASASPSVVSGSAVVSESSVPTTRGVRRKRRRVTPSPVPTLRPIPPEKIKPGVVIDETGKERKLQLGDVNVKNTMETPPFMLFPTNYAQVNNNHYYFLRADGNRNYTIYRDKGKVVGKFSLKKGIVESFIAYKNKFYAEITKNYDQYYGDEIVEIDLKRNRTIRICKRRKGEKSYTSIYGIYQGNLYWECNNEVGTFDIKKRKLISDPMASKYGCREEIIDGKGYGYKIKSGKKIQIYSFDLKSSKRKKVIEFECANKLSDDDLHYMDWGLKIDEDYIYCLDYLIPRRGGRIIKLPERIISETFMYYLDPNPSTSIFTYNKKYIFYLDGRVRIHRIDKKTGEDVIISTSRKVYVMDMQCTEDGLYVQEFDDYLSYDKLLDDPEINDYYGNEAEESASCSLYYMDCNGENVKKIWKGSN